MNGKNTSFASNNQWQSECNSQIFSFNKPLVMGIVNVTPDSFFDGGKYTDKTSIVRRVKSMINDGVDIVDIGGMSTRPGAAVISLKEELNRVITAINIIKEDFPHLSVSIDTFRSEVAKKSINAGACMINDISGGTFDEKMFETVATLNVPYVLMHIKGTPETMQKNPIKHNVTENIKRFFEKQTDKLRKTGFDKIILDPGFGFGKSLECNYRLLKELEKFKIYQYPMLVGISRKSMINKVLETNPSTALNGTTVLHVLALQKGADILRVHDVKEAKEAIKLLDFYTKSAC